MGVQADSTPGGVSPLRKFPSSVRVGASRRAGHWESVPAPAIRASASPIVAARSWPRRSAGGDHHRPATLPSRPGASNDDGPGATASDMGPACPLAPASAARTSPHQSGMWPADLRRDQYAPLEMASCQILKRGGHFRESKFRQTSKVVKEKSRQARRRPGGARV
jgi:hypothetical protein